MPCVTIATLGLGGVVELEQKLRSVQVLRGVAACSVVVFHGWGMAAGYPADSLMRNTAAGVDLFFVISGFIMANISKGRTAGQFLFDRAWRIFPMWWIAALTWFLFVGADHPAWIVTLTLWPIIDGKFILPSPGLGWTLSFEVLFYAGMALALRTRPAIPIGIFVVSLLLSQTRGVFDYIGSPMILEFLLGVWIASLPRTPKAGLLLPLGLAAVILCPANLSTYAIVLNPEFSLYRVALWGVPCALVFYGALCLEPWFKSPGLNIPVLVGDASYSIYLFHSHAIVLLKLYWPLGIAAAILTGLACHFAIERPIMRARKQVLRVLRGQRTPLPEGVA